MLLFPLLCIWLCISAATHRQTCNTTACLSWLNYCNMLTSLYIGYIWGRRQRYYSPSVSRLQSSAMISVCSNNPEAAPVARWSLRRRFGKIWFWSCYSGKERSSFFIFMNIAPTQIFSIYLKEKCWFQIFWTCLPGCHVTCDNFSRHIKQISHYLSSM